LALHNLFIIYSLFIRNLLICLKQESGIKADKRCLPLVRLNGRDEDVKITQRNLFERVLSQAVLGCAAGLLVLHPMSMFIQDISGSQAGSLTVNRLLTGEHFLMSVYFTVIGGIIGTFRAFYIHKRERLYESIRLLSITDELTSLYNRRYFMDRLEKEIARARRYSRHLSLLIIDLNNFKLYNDTYGHQEGDNLLKEIAAVLQNSIRSPDFVARYGGDEFVVVMPESDENDSLEVMNRLYSRIGANTYKTRERSIEGGTVGIGAATYPTEAQDIRGLIDLADKRLYQEKNRRPGLTGKTRRRPQQLEDLDISA